MAKCGRECEVYSRVCGYYRPTMVWNLGKQQEFKDRKVFNVEPKDGPPSRFEKGTSK